MSAGVQPRLTAAAGGERRRRKPAEPRHIRYALSIAAGRQDADGGSSNKETGQEPVNKVEQDNQGTSEVDGSTMGILAGMQSKMQQFPFLRRTWNKGSSMGPAASSMNKAPEVESGCGGEGGAKEPQVEQDKHGKGDTHTDDGHGQTPPPPEQKSTHNNAETVDQPAATTGHPTSSSSVGGTGDNMSLLSVDDETLAAMAADVNLSAADLKDSEDDSEDEKEMTEDGAADRKFGNELLMDLAQQTEMYFGQGGPQPFPISNSPAGVQSILPPCVSGVGERAPEQSQPPSEVGGQRAQEKTPSLDETRLHTGDGQQDSNLGADVGKVNVKIGAEDEMDNDAHRKDGHKQAE